MSEPLLSRLRHRDDYRLTAQRRVVAEVFEGDNVHLSADEVLRAAAERLPEISRATVYNTLRELTELGELHELDLDGRSKRYDPNVAPAHHHVVCRDCGLVYDVKHGHAAPPLDPDERHGIEVERADIVYRGTCSGCRGV